MASNDSLLWYNAPGWEKYGLAIPNFGNDTHTQNNNILELTSTVGRAMQQVMFHTDANLREPMSMNTVLVLHKMCIRVRDILSIRAVAPNEVRMESKHSKPAPEVFKVYPVPFFEVANPQLKAYCQLALMALSDAMQHTENALHFEITTNFKQDFGAYFQRIYRRISTEMFQVPAEIAKKGDFTLTEENFKAYNPNDWFARSEAIDIVPDLNKLRTEDQLHVLTNGIAVTQLPANLTSYPNATPGGNPAPQTSNTSFS